MKLVLCSEGFFTDDSVKACVELCGKPQDEISIAIINEAYAVVDGDKRWVVDNLNYAARNFPGELDIVDLLALPLEKVEAAIASKDVIFVIGGNADYLMQVYIKTGFDKLLPKLLETKVYVGSSAGSRIMGRKVSNPLFDKAFGNAEDFGTAEYLNLVDFTIVPHMNSNEFPLRRPDTFLESTKSLDFPAYGIQDDSAIVVNGDEVSFVGSEPYKGGSLR